VARNPDGTFTTRGDANRVADSTHVPAANLVGLARLRLPAVGLPVLWLRDRRYGPLVLLAVVVLAAVAVSAQRTGDPEDPAGAERLSRPGTASR
jgi:signal peptidase